MFKKTISLILSLSLIITQPIFAQGLSQLDLAKYLGQMPTLVTGTFRPTQLRYFSYDNLNNSYKILLDKGDIKDIKDNQLKEEAKELMDYFLIGLALPNDTFWVNLRPDSPDNIIDSKLEKTDLGRILLESDLQLKKDTAGMTSPQTPEGKAYWDKLYKKAGELFGTENITIPTLTRPWIVPGEIIVRESQSSAYIYKATLRVMLEEDYLSRGGFEPAPTSGRSRTAPTMRTAPTPNQYNFSDPRLKELNEYSTQIIRETIIPKLTQEVNSSKRYAQLRQVYYSLVLSRWFKRRFSKDRDGSSNEITLFKNRPLNKSIDSGDLTGLTSKGHWSKDYYFNEYKKSFQQGEYNLKEPVYTPYGQSVRSYMSGGFTAEYMNFSGPEIKAETASNPVKQLLLKNAVILDNNSNLVDPEQSLALTASALTQEALRNEGTMPVKDFILINITEKSRRGFNDEKDLEFILEACKSYMLGFSGKYVEAAKIRISQKEIKEITGTLSLYFNSSFTTRPENIAVAARYLSGIMENKFKENGIAQDFEKLGKEINNIVERLNKSEKQPEAVIPDSPASREKVLEAKNIIVKFFNSVKDKNEAYQKYINASVDNIGILLEAAKEAVKLIQEGSNRLFKDEILPFEAAHPDTFDLEKMAEIESFLEQLHKDSTIQTELDSPSTSSSAMAEGHIINDEVRKKIENIKYALKMFPFKALEFTRDSKFKKELEGLYQEVNKKIMSARDIIGVSEALKEFYAAAAGFQFQESSVMPEVSKKLAELDELKSIIEAVLKKMKNLIELDITAFEEVMLNKEDKEGKEDINFSDIESIIKELSLNNLKPAALKMKGLFETHQPSGYRQYGRKWTSIITELKIFDLSVSSPFSQDNVDSSVIPVKRGGIDFTDKAMRIGLERMGSFADLRLVLPEIANAAALDLDSEFKQIQAMALSGIRPADNRILEFAAACYYRGEFSRRLGEITACLQQAHFLDERLGKESSQALRLATMLPEAFTLS